MGVVGIGGRHYFLRDRPWTPYYSLAGGMAWTSLEVQEVDRIWNFQVVLSYGQRFGYSAVHPHRRRLEVRRNP
jgi:hypothetical protein